MIGLGAANVVTCRLLAPCGVGTGRCDSPRQVNNLSGVPEIFRGTFDVRARTISDVMEFIAAHDLAGPAADRGLRPARILPRLDDSEVPTRGVTDTAMKAQEPRLAPLSKPAAPTHEESRAIISRARKSTALRMREGMIRPFPESPAEPASCCVMSLEDRRILHSGQQSPGGEFRVGG